MEYDSTLGDDRETIRNSLDEIASEVNSALVQADLAYPIYISIPSSGYAYATFACPVDPTDSEWDRISAIVVGQIGKKIETDRLISRPLSCAMAGVAMGSADVVGIDTSFGSSI